MPIRKLVAQAIGLPKHAFSLSLRPPLDYQSNHLYDLWLEDRHLIVKEFIKAGELEDAPAREHRALTLLAPLDIAPQPVFYRPSLGPVVIYEYMEGEMWDRRAPDAHELAELSKIWQKMNAVPTDGLWISRGQEQSWQSTAMAIFEGLRLYLAWATSAYQPALPAAKLCLEQAERRASVMPELLALEPVLCFCRADPRFANVIQRPDGRLGLVDWEDCGLRDPAQDLADLLTHPNQEDLLTWREWQAFLQPYLEDRSKVDGTVSRRLHLYLAIFPIYWLSILLARGMQLAAEGTLRGWQVNELPANDRLRRYLARAIAWPQIEDLDPAFDSVSEVQFFPEE